MWGPRLWFCLDGFVLTDRGKKKPWGTQGLLNVVVVVLLDHQSP